MATPLLAGITSFLISFAFLPFVIKFSKEKKLGVSPGGRRIHKVVTPSLGGAAIFSGFTVACLCWSHPDQFSFIFVLLTILIIPFIVGLLDDLIRLKPLAKLIAQAATASFVFFLLNIRIRSFYSFIEMPEFSVPISYTVTLLTILLITNAFNLIDGIDGLAAVFSFMASLCFGAWFFFTGFYQYSLIAFALCGGILAFLFQNWEPSKIFMGDTGSLVIGSVLALLMIQFVNLNHELGTEQSLKFRSSIGTAIAIMIIPLVDTIRVIIIRISRRVSPFEADKRHIHHALISLNLSHKQAVYTLTSIHFMFILLAMVLHNTNDVILLTCIAGISTGLCLLLEKIMHKKPDARS
jgi:UDP-GlcNAc:undecaprenyl-phosphate/decaprenyl-phosphate GlcNAc-1-phosphate transferase